MWLTSYITQVLAEVTSTIPTSFGFSVDHGLIETSVEWLLAWQLAEGNFREKNLFPDYTQSPTEFQDISVTAQVVIALAELSIIPEVSLTRVGRTCWLTQLLSTEK